MEAVSDESLSDRLARRRRELLDDDYRVQDYGTGGLIGLDVTYKIPCFCFYCHKVIEGGGSYDSGEIVFHNECWAKLTDEERSDPISR